MARFLCFLIVLCVLESSKRLLLLLFIVGALILLIVGFRETLLVVASLPLELVQTRAAQVVPSVELLEVQRDEVVESVLSGRVRRLVNSTISEVSWGRFSPDSQIEGVLQDSDHRVVSRQRDGLLRVVVIIVLVHSHGCWSWGGRWRLLLLLRLLVVLGVNSEPQRL